MDETLKALQRENRILRKKLARTEHNLQRLEEHKIRADRLHRRLLHARLHALLEWRSTARQRLWRPCRHTSLL